MKLKMMIAALLVSGVAYAEEDASVTEVCANLSEFAESAAELRYEGVPMRSTMEAAAGNEFTVAIVRDAYALPDYSTEGYQRNAVREFGNEVYEYCYEQFSE